jgi:hypothetical protein
MIDHAQRNAWLKAARTLAVDPTRPVACPSCGRATLSVRNLPSDDNCVERHISCPACKRGEYLYKPVGHAIRQRRTENEN